MPSRDKYIYVAPNAVPDELSDMVGNLTNAFIDERARAKHRANTESAQLQADLAYYAANPIMLPGGGPNFAANYDRVQTRLLAFEQAYLTEREDWQPLVTQVNNQIVSTPDPAGTTIQFTYHGGNVGTLYLNDARFIQGPVVLGIQTYALRDGTPRQYVRAANDGMNPSYVKRFVVRGLSLLDVWSYYLGHDLAAAQPRAIGGAVCVANEHDPVNAGRHPAPAINAPLALNLQIISHTRGWRKRLISTVPSEREIYSTRGAPFNGHTGVVKVDLVQVLAAGHNVRDVHNIPYADAIYGFIEDDIINAVDPETPSAARFPAPTPYESQCFRGYRDVLRTREVLVDDTIPWAAINGAPSGNFIVAVGLDTSPHAQAVEAAMIANPMPGFQGQVRLNYRVHGAYFVYAVFNSQVTAQAAYDFYGPAVPGGPAVYGNAAWFMFRFLVPQLQPA